MHWASQSSNGAKSLKKESSESYKTRIWLIQPLPRRNHKRLQYQYEDISDPPATVIIYPVTVTIGFPDDHDQWQLNLTHQDHDFGG